MTNVSAQEAGHPRPDSLSCTEVETGRSEMLSIPPKPAKIACNSSDVNKELLIL